MEMKSFLILATAVLFLGSMPAAVGLEDGREYLDARYAMISCEIDFSVDVLTGIADKVLGASDLKAHVPVLAEDKAQLQALLQEGNASKFNAFVKESVRLHMREAREALKEDRKSFKEWNVSKETRATFVACRDGAILQVGKAKVALYEAHLAKKQALTENLSAKGVDVAKLSEVISGARTQVVTPLQNAVSTNDPRTVRGALKTYHLFNGGNESSVSYHFAAKYKISRLGAVLVAIAPAASDAGYGAKVAEIQGTVDSTNALLSKIADKKYAPEESEQVWGNIKQGFTRLREIIKSLKKQGIGKRTGEG